MKETERIQQLFEKLYNGSPWIDVNLHDTLSGITAEQAAKKLLPGANSIWEITQHLIHWRLNVLERVKGNVLTTPDDNYFYEIKDTSSKAWKYTLKELEESQKHWLILLNEFHEKDFLTLYPTNEMSYYEHIHGIIQHDAYHLGQIVMLSKLLQKK